MSKKDYHNQRGLRAETMIIDENIQNEEAVDLADVVPPISKEGIVVNCDVLRVRKDHDKESEVITIIPKGTIVTIDGDAIEGFFNIATTDDIFGWCMKEFIKTL